MEKGIVSFHHNLVSRATDEFLSSWSLKLPYNFQLFSVTCLLSNWPTPFPLQKEEKRKSLAKDLNKREKTHSSLFHSPAHLLEEIASYAQPRSYAVVLSLSFEKKTLFRKEMGKWVKFIYCWTCQMGKKSWIENSLSFSFHNFTFIPSNEANIF